MDVGVFVADGVADFGLAAMVEVLSTANSLREHIERPPRPWDVTTIGMGTSILSGAGYAVPTRPLASLTALPDLLIVPALNVKTPDDLLQAVSSPRNRPALQLIADARSDQVELAGACTGTFFLAEAGVLDGLTATTSWWLGPVFRHHYPNVTLDESLTLCRADGMTTAGAALAHVDLALGLVQMQSPALADLVARYLMIGDRRTQASFAIPALLAQCDPLMAAFERWVRGNLDQPILMSNAARAIGTSERSLQRTTASTVGMSPMDFVNDIRLDHATHLLRTTSLSADAVAAQVGYLNAGTLRALIRRRRGVTIRELRRGPHGVPEDAVKGNQPIPPDPTADATARQPASAPPAPPCG